MGETKQKKEGMNPNAKKIFVILSVSLGIVLIMLFSYYGPVSSNFVLKRMLISLEESSMNWRFASKAWTSGATIVQQGVTQRREKEGYYKKIYIAAIDDQALKTFGRYPFDRTVYADVINHFNSLPTNRMPAMLFFDIVIDTRSDPHSDEALIDAYKNYKGVLGEDILLSSTRDTDYQGQSTEEIIAQRAIAFRNDSLNYYSPEAQSLKRFELKKENFDIPASIRAEVFSKRIFQYNIVSPNLPQLSQYLDVMGAANIDESTHTVRKKPLLFKAIYYLTNADNSITLTNIYYPDIILAMTTSLLHSDVSNILVKPGEIVIRNAFYDGKRQDFSIPVDERFRLSINYKAYQSSDYVNHVSLADVTRAGLPKDSIVMVGAFAQGMAEDMWQSPMDNMYGIMHLAFALGTVLNRDFISELPAWINIIYVLILSLGMGLLISRGIRTTLAATLGSIVVPLIIGFILFQFRVNILMIVPLLTAVLTLIFGIVYLLLTEEKEKRFIKSTFSSYVNPELVDILIQNPDMLKLGGDSKDLTILFSDIRSFTTLSEGMTSEYLINFLNVYLTRMTDIVMDSSGTLDKYIGDAVMAFWGAPIVLPNNALSACKAALDMMKALKDFNEERAKVGDKSIDIGIGINSGVVSVGNVGSEKRKNYTVIGDAVNLASRLEGANKYYGTHIIVSEFTYEKIKDVAVVRELDLMTVKGKKLPVKIYELWDIVEK